MQHPEYRFCPTCGGALEARRLRASDPDRLVCTGCGFIVYIDPKVAVGTIIRASDDRLVLVRRAIEPGYGLWVFPGGYVDRGEVMEAAALREAKEESGLDVKLEGLINVYSYPDAPLIVVVYAATVLGGELGGDEECLEAGLFAPEAIPWGALAFRSTADALRDYFKNEWHSSKLK